jgi:glyoxylase-like metal-dependent hydrolase (beta-lactamase superfamily II)
MEQKPNVWRIGNVTVTRVVEMEIRDHPPNLIFQGLEPEQVRKTRWLQPHFASASGMLYSSIPSFIVESEGKRIIVDTCVGNDKTRQHPPFNHLQGMFLTQLAEAGFPAESIDTVLCTHLHVDHVGWNTRLVDGQWIPTFPNARYLFGRIEWEYWHQRFLSGVTVNTDSARILDAPNVLKDSVLPIVEADVHTLVEMDHQLTSEVSLMATPGHTPGHVSVSIHSNGKEAIITGDIFHHPIEIEYPELPGKFDVDLKAAERTRIEFLRAYSGRDVLILGTHFSQPTAGRIVQNGKTWLFDTSLV